MLPPVAVEQESSSVAPAATYSTQLCYQQQRAAEEERIPLLLLRLSIFQVNGQPCREEKTQVPEKSRRLPNVYRIWRIPRCKSVVATQRCSDLATSQAFLSISGNFRVFLYREVTNDDRWEDR